MIHICPNNLHFWQFVTKLLENIHVRSGKLNGSTSLENDNMFYVSFRIREQECVPWCGEI